MRKITGHSLTISLFHLFEVVIRKSGLFLTGIWDGLSKAENRRKEIYGCFVPAQVILGPSFSVAVPFFSGVRKWRDPVGFSVDWGERNTRARARKFRGDAPSILASRLLACISLESRNLTSRFRRTLLEHERTNSV